MSEKTNDFQISILGLFEVVTTRKVDTELN